MPIRNPAHKQPLREQFNRPAMKLSDVVENIEESERRLIIETTPPAQVKATALCPCKDRPASACPGEWEPGCGLGNNPKHAKAATPPAAQENV